MNRHILTHIQWTYLLHIFIHCVLFKTYLSAPTNAVINYDNFLEDIKREKCAFPDGVKLPFSSSTTFEFLSKPLSVCKGSQTTKPSKEAILICSEVFEILRNVTCHSEKNPQPKDVKIEFSKDVCSDISSLQFSNAENSQQLLKHLADKYMCDIVCADEFKSACVVLLWSYQVQQEILNMHEEETSISPSKVPTESPPQDNDKVVDPAPADTKRNPAIDSSTTTKEPSTITSNNKSTISKLVQASTQSPLNAGNPPNVEDKKSKDVSLQQTNLQIAVEDDGKGKNNLLQDNNNLITNEPNTEANEINDPKLEPIGIDDVEQIDAVKTNDLNKPVIEDKGVNEIKLITDKKPIGDKSQDRNKIQKDELNLEMNDNPDNENTVEKMVNQPVKLEDVKDEVKIENLKTTATDAKVTKAEQEGAKQDVLPLQVTAPKLSSPEPSTKIDVKTEVTKAPVVSENKVLVTASSNSDLPVTTRADLEKMEGENEVPDLDRDQDPYNDMESESEYNKVDYDGDDGFFDQSKNQKTNEEEAANVKEAKPPLNQIENFYKPRNSFGREPDDIEMIPSFPEQEDSHFFFYFLSLVFILMGGYLLFHNKQKIIALIVEGRHERRRRSHGVGYKKLETK